MPPKSLLERISHAVIYELTALLITIPGAALLFNRPLEHIGSTVIAIALLAMGWNIVFNRLFDHVYPPRLPRNLFIRSLQAIGFEGGLLTMALPLTAVLMHMSVSEALTLDMGLIAFYLPYTYLFNAIWDVLITRFLNKRVTSHVSILMKK